MAIIDKNLAKKNRTFNVIIITFAVIILHLKYFYFIGGKICPFGAAWSDQATAIDTAHNSAECSNRGICDRSTGT